ncbi:unnamed protein product [Rotaria sordida]|uniref:Uncharacterized protein n=1 Tax=Rotaria sordida TaxID=392033 RepID=A0A818RF64_9BILA|nr:unnamed protein product [Rotaria sordida]CAF3652862.1 unnamed protein product [Rotaria sordida]
MPRREAIRTLLNLQDPTNSTKLGACLPTPPPTDCSDSCSGNCGCNCVGPPGCVDEDLIYINERLQLKVHMNREDALNSIIELENYYTGLKNNLHGSPSEMVDEAWHAHILNTPMYFRFSTAEFGSYLHHIPFWSGNRKQTGQLNDDISMLEKLKKLGIQNINETPCCCQYAQINCLKPTQRYYHISSDWLRPKNNLITIFDDSSTPSPGSLGLVQRVVTN